MQATCNDLNCNLNVLHAPNRNHATIMKNLSSVSRMRHKQDYIVFQSTKQNGIQILKKAEKNKIKSFMFNAGLNSKQRNEYGGPRTYFKYWLGEMFPNDRQAGYDITRALVNYAQQVDPSNSVDIIALGGVIADGGSIERVNGLKDYIKKHPNARLQHLTYANWSKDRAVRKFDRLHQRYPHAKLYWAANDAMAEGIIQGAYNADLNPGKDIFIVGVDWDNSAVKEIKQGKLIASAGGHFLEAIWVIVLLADYHNGIDFKSESLSFKSEMPLLTDKNAEEYFNKINDNQIDKVDFKKFSKFYNKKLKKYDFTLKAILNEIDN
ncbi:hypothetical protein BGC07_18060 [Piscirickettsia litoralis]|uniref:Periplasmic binding protein domain-containing protein n=2 Tax=Piscirickettsia litoralis TaxID=1891921 RepID=A0ABX2ZY73_9GAMM|nr:hypothetical protein BGC07_18060 [Piscirickettsia litoralis]